MISKKKPMKQEENRKNEVMEAKRRENIKTRQSSQLHTPCRVTEQGEYREVLLGFCDTETNNDLDKNSFKSLVEMDALLELIEKVKNWRP